MLASEPPSARMHAGGGISVLVNGAALDAREPAANERLRGSLGNQDNAETPSDWANGTITRRAGAQQCSDIVQLPNASSSVNINNPSSLVHVIRVNPSDADGGDAVDTPTDVPPQAKIRITTGPHTTYVHNKISVVVGSSLDDLIRAEDERSSSGASSAPGSDCERSDSDREADDGTDSGFSPSRRPCPTIRVNSEFYNGDSNVICNGQGNNVRLTIASYSDKESEGQNRVLTNGDQCDMQFHLRELDSTSTDKKTDTDEVQIQIDTAHALLSGQGSGTFTLKNRVRSSIVSLLVQRATNRNYALEERGRVVFYTTSMGVVRTTSERCQTVKKILDTLMVRYEERDLFMNKGFQREVKERLGLVRCIVPQVFVEGKHLGTVGEIVEMNEIGVLRERLRPYKRLYVGGTCQQCGGHRFLMCAVCGGSKKSATHRHHFSATDNVALRCVNCDESGLVRCPNCIMGDGY